MKCLANLAPNGNSLSLEMTESFFCLCVFADGLAESCAHHMFVT